MAAKTCEMCKARRVYTGKGPGVDEAPRLSDMCNFCYTEAGWENTHSDYAHDDAGTSADEKANCWICFPNLNLASRPATERTGTSRAGMTINVPIRAAGSEKAKVTASKLPAGHGHQIRTTKGVTSLRSKSLDLVLSWDERGRFFGGSVGGKRVRNVAEALRLAR
jgi:hypothetical protein